MKSLIFFTLILFSSANLFSQSDKPKEKPQEKPKEKVEEVPAPEIMEVKEVKRENAEGVKPVLMEPPPPAMTEPNVDEANDEQPFSYVEQMPVFPEGQQAMYKFISDNLQYPEIAKQNGISGQVILQFVVSSDGTIKNAKVMRGIGGGCNEEALRILNAMPKWNPGKHNGRAVPVMFTLPIKFVIQ